MITSLYANEKYKQYGYHGGPLDRGSADAYYGRPKSPHKYPNGTYNGERVIDLTQEEIDAYNFGYDNETDRKQWE